MKAQSIMESKIFEVKSKTWNLLSKVESGVKSYM